MVLTNTLLVVVVSQLSGIDKDLRTAPKHIGHPVLRSASWNLSNLPEVMQLEISRSPQTWDGETSKSTFVTPPCPYLKDT